MATETETGLRMSQQSMVPLVKYRTVKYNKVQNSKVQNSTEQ